MNADRIKNAFLDYLEGRGLKQNNLSLQSFVAIFINYYREVEFSEVDRAEDGDLLLFQYGTYDWGEGRYFEVDFTRQFYEFFPDSEDHEIHQQSFTFYYDPAGFEKIEQFNTWSNEHCDLTEFENTILNSSGFVHALGEPIRKLDITIEHVC